MPSSLPIVFIGPSLPREDIGAYLKVDAEIRGPVKRGDFDRLDPSVRVAVVIDGVFLSEQAVSPREILNALRRGVRVVGASSMGALRAAELAPFGMEGIGYVYDMYTSGETMSDADVAMVFDPDTFEALTIPVVNVIRMLQVAVSAGIVTRPESELLIAEARAIYFMDLTYPEFLRRAGGSILCPDAARRLSVFVGEHEALVDAKRSDAIAALNYLDDIVSRRL